MSGRVVKYDAARAFGKLWAVGAEHCSSTALDVVTVTPGERVTFRLIETDRGPRAVEVRPLEVIT